MIEEGFIEGQNEINSISSKDFFCVVKWAGKGYTHNYIYSSSSIPLFPHENKTLLCANQRKANDFTFKLSVIILLSLNFYYLLIYF